MHWNSRSFLHIYGTNIQYGELYTSIVAIYLYNELRLLTTSTEQIHVADGNIAEELTSFMTAYH